MGGLADQLGGEVMIKRGGGGGDARGRHGGDAEANSGGTPIAGIRRGGGVDGGAGRKGGTPMMMTGGPSSGVGRHAVSFSRWGRLTAACLTTVTMVAGEAAASPV